MGTLKIRFSTGVFLALVLVLFVQPAGADDIGGNNQRGSMHSFVPANGFIPNEATAAAVAEVILVPIYGRDVIESQKPFTVTLSKNVWTVTGAPPKIGMGGVFLIQISKKDARVLRVTHGQ